MYLSLKQPQPQVSPRHKRSQSAPPARANPSLQRPKLRSSKPQKKMRQSKKRPLHPSLATHKMSRLKAVHSKMSVKIRHGQMTTPATTTSAAVSRLALALICQPLLPKALKNVWKTNPSTHQSVALPVRDEWAGCAHKAVLYALAPQPCLALQHTKKSQHSAAAAP